MSYQYPQVTSIATSETARAAAAASLDYKTRIQEFIHNIGYRFEPPVADPVFTRLFHAWITDELQPILGWDKERMAAIEDVAHRICIRCYPHACTELKMLMGKLTALGTVIDDSLGNDTMYSHVALFTHKMYMGEPQPAGTIFPLYEKCIRELSAYYGADGVLRGIGVTSWMTFMEAASLEERMQVFDEYIRASPLDQGYQHLVEARRQEGSGESPDDPVTSFNIVNAAKSCGEQLEPSPMKLEADAIAFPYFLRTKTAVTEGYAAAIFKADREQALPLTRYIKAIPDIAYTVAVVNDVLSFHKEELQGETINLVHLLTQCLTPARKQAGYDRWDANNTIDFLCAQLEEAFRRIDSLLGMDESDSAAIDLADTDKIVDAQIAKQWRAWRHGYISWHLECERYKLDFLRHHIDP